MRCQNCDYEFNGTNVCPNCGEKYTNEPPKKEINKTAIVIVIAAVIICGLFSVIYESQPPKKYSSQSTPTETAKPETTTATQITTEATEAPAYTREDFIEEIKSGISDWLTENEKIIDITFENDTLVIYDDLSGVQSIFSTDDLAFNSTSSFTDYILEMEQYDDLWDEIKIDFGEDIGYILNKKSNIVNGDYGRYFEAAKFKLIKE